MVAKYSDGNIFNGNAPFAAMKAVLSIGFFEVPMIVCVSYTISITKTGRDCFLTVHIQTKIMFSERTC